MTDLIHTIYHHDGTTVKMFSSCPLATLYVTEEVEDLYNI